MRDIWIDEVTGEITERINGEFVPAAMRTWDVWDPTPAMLEYRPDPVIIPCPYCGQRSERDARGGCCACGAPRE